VFHLLHEKQGTPCEPSQQGIVTNFAIFGKSGLTVTKKCYGIVQRNPRIASPVTSFRFYFVKIGKSFEKSPYTIPFPT